MHKHMGSVAALLMSGLLILAGFFAAPAHAQAGNADAVSIPVSVTTVGQGIPDETYAVAIEPIGDAPVPEEAIVALRGEELSAATYRGTIELSFKDAAVGIYRYKVFQIAPENTTGRGSYDDAVFSIEVAFEHPSGQADETRTIASIRKAGDAGDLKYDACTFTNRYANLPDVLSDPPVAKKIAGDEPPAASTFTFVLEAVSGAPMPEGAVDGKIEATIDGEGTTEFGASHYTEAGVYAYRCYEKAGDAAGYTYDETVYTVKVVVRETVDGFVAERTIEDEKGAQSDGLVFTNFYKTPGTPSTPGGATAATTTTPKKAQDRLQASPDTSDMNSAGAVQAAAALGLAFVAAAACLKIKDCKNR